MLTKEVNMAIFRIRRSSPDRRAPGEVDMLSTWVWVAQGLVALVMTLAGLTKLAMPREQLAKRMHWAAAWPRWRIKLLGLAEVAGAVGLIVPMATRIAPVLTPIAAVCVALLMAGAVRTHQKLGENVAPALVVGLLCVGIAAARFATVAHAAA
jgi:uncharacterized membrane protein